MQLNDEAVKTFREIWTREFGEEINEAAAREKAGRLFELFKAIYKPLKNKNYEKEKLS